MMTVKGYKTRLWLAGEFVTQSEPAADRKNRSI